MELLDMFDAQELLPKLFLSDYKSAQQEEELAKRGITHILSAMAECGPVRDEIFKEFKHLVLEIKDEVYEDILSCLPFAIPFIKQGIKAGGTAIISFTGTSRAPAFALAYLMKKKKLTVREAFAQLQRVRYSTPNAGFLKQLEIWYKMQYKFDERHPAYIEWKQWAEAEHARRREDEEKWRANQYAAGGILEVSAVLDNAMKNRLQQLAIAWKDSRRLPPTALARDPEGAADIAEADCFLCSNCRRRLFTRNNVVAHRPNEDPCDLDKWFPCTQVVVEPLSWLTLPHVTLVPTDAAAGELKAPSGAVHCPQCRVQVGEYHLERSPPCSCGTKLWPSMRFMKVMLVRAEPTHGGTPTTPLPSPATAHRTGDTTGSGSASLKDSAGSAGGAQTNGGNATNAKQQEEHKGGLKGFLGRFKRKKKDGNQSESKASKTDPAPAPAAGSGSGGEGGEGTNKGKVKAEGANAADEYDDDNKFRDPTDHEAAGARADADNVVIAKSVDEFPKELKAMVKAAQLSDEAVGRNFDVLCNILHFLTKKVFYREAGGPPIYKSKHYSPKVPSAEEVFAKGNAKKNFKILSPAGKGGYGRVFVAKDTHTKQKVAIKQMANATEKDKRYNLIEIGFLKACDHPNIVRFYEAYELKDEVWVVMEFMEGGTLTEAVKGYNFKEKHVAYVAREILKALHYLHNKNLIHRDLKSGNVMMTIKGEVKLIDFGLCVDATEHKTHVQMCGSPFWMPPEMIQGKPHGFAVDIWSMAICILELANRHPPNQKSALRAMFIAATEGCPNPLDEPGQWSNEFKDFLSQCLRMDPAERPTAEQLLAHPFLKSAVSSNSMKKILSQVFIQKSLEMMNF